MHLCVACKRLMEDEFDEHRITAGRVNVISMYKTLSNPICDKCLEAGWRFNIDGSLVLVDLNDAYNPVVPLSDYIMNEGDDK